MNEHRTKEDLFAELFSVVPKEELSTAQQLNVAATVKDIDVLNAFRGLAWLRRKTYIDLLAELVELEIAFDVESGRIDQERRNQSKEAVRQARLESRGRIV